MIDLRDFFADNFFVITSDNCAAVNSKLYGFAITDESIILQQNDYNSLLPDGTAGTFVNAVREKDSITIQQDYYGSYGLYLYQTKDYFAISNSFLCLVQEIRKTASLSLNMVYLKNFITEPYYSQACGATPLSEVRMLPAHAVVTIDIPSRSLNVQASLKRRNYIPLDSQEAIKLLDRWKHKYASLAKTLLDAGCHVYTELSGGMDSRAAFSAFIAQGTDLNKVTVKSMTDEFHKEDLEIASEIARIYGFRLNGENTLQTYKVDPEYALLGCFLSIGCYHKQYHLKDHMSPKPFFRFCGNGGESLRAYLGDDIKQYISGQRARKCYDTPDEYSRDIEQTLTQALEDKNFRYSGGEDIHILHQFCLATLMPNHFGKSAVRDYLCNMVTIAPLMDPELQKLRFIEESNSTSELLLALIYNRYLPEISHVGFDKNRALDDHIQQRAKEIGKSYPLAEAPQKEFKIIGGERLLPPVSEDTTNARQILIKYFASQGTERQTRKLFSYALYCAAEYDMIKNVRFPYSQSDTLVAVSLLCSAVEGADIFSLDPIFPNSSWYRLTRLVRTVWRRLAKGGTANGIHKRSKVSKTLEKILSLKNTTINGNKYKTLTVLGIPVYQKPSTKPSTEAEKMK